MDSKKKKKIWGITIGSIGAFFVVVIIPIILTFSILIAPIAAISNFFKSIGNWFSSENNEIIEMFDDYIRTEHGQDMLREFYLPFVKAEERVEIPIAWLVIPNVLAGVEQPTPEQIQAMIDILVLKEGETYKLNSLDNYLEELRLLEPYYTAFEGKTTNVISKYVTHINVFDFYQPLSKEYLASIGVDEFLYPFAEKGTTTDEYGPREEYQTENGSTGGFHYGTDIVFPYPNNCGVPIYAVYYGTVIRSTFDNGAGYFVNVENDNIIVKYFHLNAQSPLKTGDTVKKGDYIGAIGNTGKSLGCHLHLETYIDGQSVNSRNFIDYDNPKLP